MVYKIEIIETLSKTVEIEAEDYTEAKNEVERKHIVIVNLIHTQSIKLRE